MGAPETAGGVTEAAAPAMAGRQGAWYAAVITIVVATVVRIVVGAWLPLFPDEAYYWEWSRHLSGGYFDHPPMIALLIRIGTFVFGHHPIGVRILPILCGSLASLAIAGIARRIGDELTALEAAILITVMPLAAAGLVLATPDAPLLASMSVAIYYLVVAFQSAPRSSESLIAWCAAGVALGCAFSSKYTSIFLPVATLICVASHRSLRSRFTEWGPYAACVIATLVFVPVLVWNSQHQWISFSYQIEHGLGNAPGSFLRTAWRNEGDLIGGQAGLATPILFVLIVVAVWKNLRPAFGPERWLLALVSASYLGFFTYSALRKHVEPNWPAPAYIGGVVLCAAFAWSEKAKRWRAAGISLAGVLSIAVYVQAFVPLFPLPPAKDPVARGFGWGSLADAADRATHAPGGQRRPTARAWIAADRYQDAAEIAWHSGDYASVFSLNLGGRPNQYDLWPRFPSRAFPGDRLVVAVDETQGPHDTIVLLGPYFDSVLRGELVEIKRGNDLIATRRMYVLDGWRGGWPR
ncbi:MAG TPA: glycosyltransferase family 39 protein [Gemmatimonadaceae bacterium]